MRSYKPAPPPLLPGAGSIHYDRELRALSQGIDGLSNELRALIEAAIPSGVIVMWSGSIGDIPDGWLLCDGTNGTPDLRDRFIAGAGGALDVGDTGGSATATLTEANLPAHSHGAGTLSANSNGAHTHSVSGSTSWADLQGVVSFRTLLNSASGIFSVEFNNAGTNNRSGVTGNDGIGGARVNASHSHTISGTAASAGAHTHTISGSTGSIGSGVAFSIVNPFYALAFIMKA